MYWFHYKVMLVLRKETNMLSNQRKSSWWDLKPLFLNFNAQILWFHCQWQVSMTLGSSRHGQDPTTQAVHKILQQSLLANSYKSCFLQSLVQVLAFLRVPGRSFSPVFYTIFLAPVVKWQGLHVSHAHRVQFWSFRALHRIWTGAVLESSWVIQLLVLTQSTHEKLQGSFLPPFQGIVKIGWMARVSNCQSTVIKTIGCLPSLRCFISH